MMSFRSKASRWSNARIISSRDKAVRKSFLRIIGACLLTVWTVFPSHADVINFDDLDASAGDIGLSGISPYYGFSWTNVFAYTNTPGFPGFDDGIVSSPNAAYTAGDALATPIVSVISATAPFNFISAYLGSGWYDNIDVNLTGRLNGTQEFSQTVTVNTSAAQLFTFNFIGINELDIISAVTASTSDPFGCGASGCSQITMDNLTLEPSNAVPEPSNATLVCCGLMAALCVVRRKLRR